MAELPLAIRWARLEQDGLLAADAFASRADELASVRAVAAGGLGAARVFDGHRKALERLLEHRAGDVDERLRRQLASGQLALGVWGADPGPGEGPPAQLDETGDTVSGVKTFCSGAGQLDLAIVLVRRTPAGPPIQPPSSTCVTPAASPSIAPGSGRRRSRRATATA